MNNKYVPVFFLESEDGKFKISKIVKNFDIEKKELEFYDDDIVLHFYKNYKQEPSFSVDVDNVNFIKDKLYSFLIDFSKDSLNAKIDDEEVDKFFDNYSENDVINFISILQDAMLKGFVEEDKRILNYINYEK